MANWIEQADQQLSVVLADWSLITTAIALAIVSLLAYPILFPDEPDTHPLLLARQSQASPVRQKNESAAYRSPETPHGYGLKTGLNVKPPGAPRWASGKDGDLRDVWREVCKGGQKNEDGTEVSKGLIMTVLGSEEVEEHEVEDVSNYIAIIGKHLKDKGVKRVAIYLPNSLEYLVTIFACAYNGLTPILLPFNQAHPKVYDILNDSQADGIICSAGALPPADLEAQCSSLRLLTLVVEKSSRHMEWAGKGSSKLQVGVWHELIDAQKTTAASSVPEAQEGEKLGDIVTVWQPVEPTAKAQIVTFTQGNFVAAIGALLSSLPIRQRLGPQDLFLPANSFVYTYTLCWTLAALFSHASVAINSVAEPGVDLASATRSVSPTVIVASAETLSKMHAKEQKTVSGGIQKLGMASSAQTMSAGRMPTDTLLFKLLAPSTSSSSGGQPGQLRLILTAERLGTGTPPLTSAMLSDLRIFTRARICYALTAAKVAGAIAQSNLFDYRIEAGAGHGHFGGVLSSVEVKLLSDKDHELKGTQPVGALSIEGPAVSGGIFKPGVQAKVREDGCLQLA